MSSAKYGPDNNFIVILYIPAHISYKMLQISNLFNNVFAPLRR